MPPKTDQKKNQDLIKKDTALTKLRNGVGKKYTVRRQEKNNNDCKVLDCTIPMISMSGIRQPDDICCE